jgi:hypothetical protein
MIVNLPIVEEVFDETTQSSKSIPSTITVDIDTSFYAHQKWAEQFESTMGMDLVQYTKLVAKWTQDESVAREKLLGILKLLYCYINSPKLPTFTEFLKLFKPQNALQLIEKVGIVLKEVNKTVSKN